MIGNDIVDLRQAALESNWRRKGYLNKLFTATEQQWILKAENPDQMIWLLWSMKESAYKIYSRRKNLREFAPLKLICKTQEINGEKASGSVACENHSFFSQTILTTDFIHTIASEHYPLQAVSVKISGYDLTDTRYRNTDPATVSHHGRYLALAYL